MGEPLDLVPNPVDLSIFEDQGGSSSLRRRAYRCLRDQIVTLKLRPGAPLLETALVEQLDLGRTPIREALQWLACQGLVVLQPRRGAAVAPIGVTDLQQLFELRQCLEGFAARLAAERATQEEMSTMEALLAGLHADDSTQAHIETDRAFHTAVALSAHNKFLRASLSRLYDLNVRLWYLVLDRIGPMHAAVEQHRAVLDAITNRDGQSAEVAIRAHITEFHDRIRAVI